jgi:hypothetical protein
METITSRDGTTLAVERHGNGSPLVVVGGALCDRARTRDTALALAARHTVLNYDRRGRGDSGAAAGGLEREIEDLAAVLDAAGAPAAVYGHSSGAALAVQAAAAGVPATRLVLHDPPYGPDDDGQRAEARAYLDALLPALAERRHDDAVALFFGLTGLPPEVVDGWRGEPWWPATAAMAPTLVNDAEALGYAAETGGSVPHALLAQVPQPALVLIGSESPVFMRGTAHDVTAALPAATLETLPGQSHAASPESVAAALATFLT